MSISTSIIVRVIANDGKFLGDDIGGAAITIRDAQTQEILAQGATEGDSGPNGAGGVMCVSLKRGQPIPMDDSTSAFTTSLSLSAPRRIEVTAFGPLAARASANTVSATTWIYPGRHMTAGNGLLLELHGLICQIVSPVTHTTVKANTTVEIVANVAMMCGCPISDKKKKSEQICPGDVQPWLSKDFVVSAVICGPVQNQIDLTWNADQDIPGRFTASIPVSKAGVCQMTIFAEQKSTGNTGVDFSSFIVQ